MSFLDYAFGGGDRSSEIGDYIGTESCVDLMASLEEMKSPPPPLINVDERQGRGRLNRSETKPRKEFPPPIPMLARTENQSPHMPWTLKRYYSGDGRLVIKEVRVPHHDYFKVNRSDGRLTLELIPMDDEFLPIGLGIDDDDDDDAISDSDAAAAAAEGGGEEEERLVNPTVEEVSEDPIDESDVVNLTVEDEFAKLDVSRWNYGGDETAACLFKVNVQSIRPVQI